MSYLFIINNGRIYQVNSWQGLVHLMTRIASRLMTSKAQATGQASKLSEIGMWLVYDFLELRTSPF